MAGSERGRRAPETTRIAQFAWRPHQLDGGAREQMKRHLLDSPGSLIFSLVEVTGATP